jgi:hypothetical protein
MWTRGTSGRIRYFKQLMSRHYFNISPCFMLLGMWNHWKCWAHESRWRFQPTHYWRSVCIRMAHRSAHPCFLLWAFENPSWSGCSPKPWSRFLGEAICKQAGYEIDCIWQFNIVSCVVCVLYRRGLSLEILPVHVLLRTSQITTLSLTTLFAEIGPVRFLVMSVEEDLAAWSMCSTIPPTLKNLIGW